MCCLDIWLVCAIFNLSQCCDCYLISFHFSVLFHTINSDNYHKSFSNPLLVDKNADEIHLLSRLDFRCIWDWINYCSHSFWKWEKLWMVWTWHCNNCFILGHPAWLFPFIYLFSWSDMGCSKRNTKVDTNRTYWTSTRLVSGNFYQS